MRSARHRLRTQARTLALCAVIAMGLVSIVGTSGGGLTLTPPYIPPNPVPPPSGFFVLVEPSYQTVQVGSAAHFVARTYASGDVSYSWARSRDGGGPYTVIPGASSGTYSIPNVTLADDATHYRVTATASTGKIDTDFARLAVSNYAPVVFPDGDFPADDWVSTPLVQTGQPLFISRFERATSGGNPDAFLKLMFELPQTVVSVSLALSRRSAVYDPGSQGGVYTIDYADDCKQLQGGGGAGRALILEQGSRAYIARHGNSACGPGPANAWVSSYGLSSLGSDDFSLLSGPPCGAGEACPDFSVSAAPMRFGLRLSASPAQIGGAVAYGIDNWTVKVWRR